MSFPLPVASTWKSLHGLELLAGKFALSKIVWPAEWHREGTKIEEKHVGILQRRDLSFVFVYFDKETNAVKMLTQEHWHVFDQKKATSASNRYFVKVQNETFLLPYLPSTLYRKWVCKIDSRCDAYVESLWNEKKKDYTPQNISCSWERHTANYKGYISCFDKERCSVGGVDVDITKPFETLSDTQKEVVKRAFRLVHLLIPNLILPLGQNHQASDSET